MRNIFFVTFSWYIVLKILNSHVNGKLFYNEVNENYIKRIQVDTCELDYLNTNNGFNKRIIRSVDTDSPVPEFYQQTLEGDDESEVFVHWSGSKSNVCIYMLVCLSF